MYRQKYFFTPHTDDICVDAADLYMAERGYGFITEQNMEQQPLLMLPELNGGFMPVPWHRMYAPTQIEQQSYGCAIRMDKASWGAENRQIPLRFKCNVPADGSYRVRVTIHSEEVMSDIRIFTGRRCLGAYIKTLPAGEVLMREMFTEVCGIIPRGHEQVYENHCIEVTVTSDRPCISEIEIESIQCPVIYIAGDSTVTDQSAEYPYAPETSYAGWGQMLPYFIKGNLTVSNHSHSGLTTESFRTEGHAEVPMSRCKAGDYMLFQFGHNDQKLMHLKAHEGYMANLEKYINECRSLGVYPLLVTPVARNSWRGNDGTYNDLLKEYADACIELGAKMSVPVLDLHRLSMEFVMRLQKEDAKRYFYPSDYTHHNDFGAQQMAAMVCREILRSCKIADKDSEGYQWLASRIQENPELWDEPVRMEPLQRPAGFLSEDAPEEFEEPDRPEDTLLRAEALDMVIRRAGFFITNVYNDLFTDIVGHEWYAGAIECGLQNGILSADMCSDGKFYPLEPVTLMDFIIFLMMAYGSRKTLPKAQPCPYDGVVQEPARALISAACQLGLLAADGTDSLNGYISRHRGAELCRTLKIM